MEQNEDACVAYYEVKYMGSLCFCPGGSVTWSRFRHQTLTEQGEVRGHLVEGRGPGHHFCAAPGLWERRQPGSLGRGSCLRPLGALAPLCPVHSPLPARPRHGERRLTGSQNSGFQLASSELPAGIFPRPTRVSGASALSGEGPLREPPALPGTVGREQGSWTISPLPAPSTGTSSPTTSCWTSKVSPRRMGREVCAPCPQDAPPALGPPDTCFVFSPRRACTPDGLQHRHHHKGWRASHRTSGDQAVHG